MDDTSKVLNEELELIIVDLCYLDFFSYLKDCKEHSAHYYGVISFENGLKIEYTYTFSSEHREYDMDVAVLICLLLFDRNIPVLFFKTFINEGNYNLWDNLGFITSKEKEYSLEKAVKITNFVKEALLVNTEWYHTTYHVAHWMKEYLEKKRDDALASLTGYPSTYEESKQKEIDREENAWIRLEDKENVRKELEQLIDDLKVQIFESLVEAVKEDDILEENKETLNLTSKIGSVLMSNIEKEKQKFLK